MGKKAKLYLLITINLLAWGYVGYKVYSALQGDDESDFALNKTSIKKIDANLKEEKEQLLLNYPDPFLKGGDFSERKINSGNSSSGSLNNKPTTVVKQVTKPTTIPVVTPPVEIKYLGLVKNNTSGLQTALLSVNGKSLLVKLNDVVEGYVIKEISTTHILATKGKEKITISK